MDHSAFIIQHQSWNKGRIFLGPDAEDRAFDAMHAFHVEQGGQFADQAAWYADFEAGGETAIEWDTMEAYLDDAELTNLPKGPAQ